MNQIALLILYLGVILLAAEGFTNAVEWLGRKLNLGDGAVGSILAAVGTALPETIIPVFAFLKGSGGDIEEVGIGAILGAPFMLATLAFFISGVTVWILRGVRRPLALDARVVKRDLSFFLLVYGMAILTAFIPLVQIRKTVSVLLIFCYIGYLVQTLRTSQGQNDSRQIAMLYVAGRRTEPRFSQIIGQMTLALLAIIWGAGGFVSALQNLALSIGIPVFILSLILTPIATELPEKFNSVLWLRQSKDTLAIGNITGAMVFQSSVIPALGIVFTPWQFNQLALISAFAALAAAMIPYLSLRKRGVIYPGTLMCCGIFYLIFIGCVLQQKGF